MTDLADFLRARYAERRAIAQAATPGAWEGVVDRHQRGEVDASVWADSISYYVTEKITSGGRHEADAHHIAANNPADVLADLDAKLAIVDAYAPKTPGPRTDAELHADEEHPAWEYRSMEGTWTPQDGWESNVDLNGGYQVTGYTELSYWRRRLPAGQERQPRAEPLVLRILARPFAGHPDYQEDWAA